MHLEAAKAIISVHMLWKSKPFVCFTDADSASYQDCRESTAGYVFALTGGEVAEYGAAVKHARRLYGFRVWEEILALQSYLFFNVTVRALSCYQGILPFMHRWTTYRWSITSSEMQLTVRALSLFKCMQMITQQIFSLRVFSQSSLGGSSFKAYCL